MSDIKSGFADINGAKIYYEVTGTGQPLVFVHAGIADNRLWDDQVPVFSQKYQVIRYDMRGYGKSEPVDLEFSHREDLIALLGFLGIEKAILVGCSMGGMISMDTTFAAPELVSALVMVCSGPNGLEIDLKDHPYTPIIEAKFEAVEAAEKAKDWALMNEIETQIWFDGRGRTPTDIDPTKRAKALDMNRIAIEHAAKELGSYKKGIGVNAPERLEELTIPLLIIVGALDTPYALAVADVMVERIPNTQKVLIENTAHLPSLERPAEFNAVLSTFLDRIS